MKKLLKILFVWAIFLLPGAAALYFLHPLHGWLVSILASLGIYLIIGTMILITNVAMSIHRAKKRAEGV